MKLYKQLLLFMLSATVQASNEARIFGDLGQPISASSARIEVIKLPQNGNRGGAKSSSKVALARIDGGLWGLHSEFQNYLLQKGGQGARALPFKSSNYLAPIDAGYVVIDTAAASDPQVLAKDLSKLGAQKVTVSGRMVSGRLPLAAIPGLKRLSSMQFVRPAYYVLNEGSATSQGDAAMRSDIARMSHSVDGAGVTVGSLSDSYDCLGGASESIASGDLPANVTVLEEAQDCTSATDEGRANMEIIHDIAPGAALSFHTALNGQADFAQGILDLAAAGAKVISDDVIYLAEPFYQDGIIAQAVNTVKGMGVAYFSSAGNGNRKGYESSFRGSGQGFDLGYGPGELHDFDPGPGVDYCQQITIPVGATLILVFQWDQPFFSVSGGKGSRNDLDIILTDASCTSVLAASANYNIGGDPVEIIGGANPGPATTFGLMIEHFDGPKSKLMKMINVGSSSISFDQFGTQTGTSWGHSAAQGGLGVGAANYLNTPVFGVTPPIIENFSSVGGTPILFNTNGKRLNIPDLRQQPGIVAPDGVDTTFFGVNDTDDSGYPNFFGTSASAPHAAGVAALLKERLPSITPEETYAVLKSTAIDMDDPGTSGFDTGFDYATGFGLIQADAALAAMTPNSSGIHDLALVKITASTTVKGMIPITRNVKVTIQNHSPHNETITASNLGDGISTGLVRLNVNVVDDDDEACAATSISLDIPRSLKNTKILKPKEKLTVTYWVTYHCSAAKKIKNDVTPGDYSHDARVYHEALDGNPDTHIFDDICRRSVMPPFMVDPNPDGKIKDKGCGAKKADKTFGNPVVTNVVG